MDIIDFYRHEQKRLHDEMRGSVSDLTPEEWNHKIEGRGNSIAFLVWHCARTEDNILRFILQGRPTIWAEGNWHERLNLPHESRVQVWQWKKLALFALPTRRSLCSTPTKYGEYMNLTLPELLTEVPCSPNGL